MGTVTEELSPTGEFGDLLAANRRYAETFKSGGFDGIARAGVLVLTCMDSRIDPLRMLGLDAGDAKILRNAGARLSVKKEITNHQGTGSKFTYETTYTEALAGGK